MNNNFTFDDEKAYAMCYELQQAWNLEVGAFKHYRDKQMPEATLPSNVEPKSKEHANYLFWCSVTNYQTVADELFPRMRNLHEKQPEMFNPAHVREVDDDELASFVEQIKHIPDEMFRRWRYDADLFKEYDDNITNTHKTENIVDAQKEVMKFSGFAYKQSALLLYWLQKYDIIESFDETDLNIPVDVHVQRISVRRDVCDFEGKTRQGVLEKF
ncbi:MAG: hypothetical protein KKI14_02625, partial [Nanoarchaeota archaeon]|nr:hypothetical protein [Nanoarchaeota archaeon]